MWVSQRRICGHADLIRERINTHRNLTHREWPR